MLATISSRCNSGWAADFDGAPKVQAVFGVAGATGNTEVFAISAA